MSSPVPSVGQVFGRYRVLERLGHGGMGVVYRARDDRLQRDVAIKVLPPGAICDDTTRKRFRSEAKTLSKLSHPNIASVFDFDAQDDADFIVMELVPGSPLSSRIAGRPLPEQELLGISVQIAQGLEDAHEHGVVHRDLKPGNIVVTPKGQVKILDFGLARVWRTSTVAPTASYSAPKVEGTLAYMAPEQLKGRDVDLRSDLWAMGVVMYEMATGKHPFSRPEIGGTLEAILHEEPEMPRQLNPELSSACESVILQALDKNPERRFQTAGELRRALEHLRNPSTVGNTLAFPLQSSSSLVRHTARRPWLLGILALICVALLLLFSVPSLRQRLWKPATKSALPERKLVAVLPFRNIGSDPDMNAFSDGLTETLSSKLGEFTETHALQVISTQEIRSTDSTTTEKARANYGVNLVIEGSLQKIGSTVRINCHLVDAVTRRLLQADTITASATNSFALEDDVVNGVLKLLAVNLAPQERQQLQKRGTTQSAAYDYYLRARGYMQDYDKPENITAAIAAYKRAAELDPNFALAYAGIGEAYWREFNLSHDRFSVDQANTACRKAVSLAEQSSEAHFCLGRVLSLTGQPNKALEQFELAVSLDPKSDEAYRGLAEQYSSMGKPQNAEATFQRAIKLRPQYWAGYSWLGNFYYRQARYDDAIKMFKKVLELSPDNSRAASNLGAMYVMKGQYEDAIVECKKSIAMRPTVNGYNNLGYAYFGLHRFAESAATFEEGLKLDEKNYILWGNLGDARYWTPNLRAQSQPAYAKAIELATAKLRITPRDDYALGLLASYYAMSGKQELAIRTLHRALSVAPKSADVLYRAALIYNHFGDKKLTIEWIAKAVEAGVSVKSIIDQPDFIQLHGDPAFEKALHRAPLSPATKS